MVQNTTAPTRPIPAPGLTSRGRRLDLSDSAFGFLEPSAIGPEGPAGLRARLRDQGYLYLPGFHPREEVLSVRRELARAFAAEGVLDPSEPEEACIPWPKVRMSFRPDLAKDCRPLLDLVYGPRMMAFFADFLGGEPRHLDYTWFRAVAPGWGTTPHTDIVYMGRGTQDLFTVWTPYGDIPLETGGLMILEGSHKLDKIRKVYGRMDVDSYCANRPPRQKPWWGELSPDPVSLRAKLGGRWLTAERYRMGDIVIFGMHLVHGSLDNAGREIRLSSDTRYQLASEPADERWVGEAPIGHSQAGKRGRIC